MSEFSVHHLEKGRCEIEHKKNSKRITTDLPPEYGGKGRSFSSTDLVASALGTCYFTSVEEILRREGHDLRDVKLSVKKVLSEKPKKLDAIQLLLTLQKPPSEKLLKLLNKSLHLCPVERSLHESVTISLNITARNEQNSESRNDEIP